MPAFNRRGIYSCHTDTHKQPFEGYAPQHFYARFPSINFTNAHNIRFAGIAIPSAAPRCTIRPLR
jgi:hypothetical protein